MIECKDTGECVEKYDDYLLTKHWRSKRKEIIAERSGVCQKCKIKIPEGKMHVHHLTYERIGDELATDLMLLCEDCHNAIHRRGKKKASPKSGGKTKKKSCQNCKYSQIMKYKNSRRVLYCNVKVCECSDVCNKHKWGEVKKMPKDKKNQKNKPKKQKCQKK